jgi:hypothetical protein
LIASSSACELFSARPARIASSSCS